MAQFKPHDNIQPDHKRSGPSCLFTPGTRRSPGCFSTWSFYSVTLQKLTWFFLMTFNSLSFLFLHFSFMSVKNKIHYKYYFCLVFINFWRHVNRSSSGSDEVFRTPRFTQHFTNNWREVNNILLSCSHSNTRTCSHSHRYGSCVCSPARTRCLDSCHRDRWCRDPPHWSVGNTHKILY